MPSVETKTIEQQRTEAKASYEADRPANYHFSRRYYEGGYRYSDWITYGFTGKKYYKSFYMNMGTMIQEISKDEFDEWMPKCLNDQQWTSINLGEPNWQMMET